MSRLRSYGLVAAIGASATVGAVLTFLVLRSAWTGVGHTDFAAIYAMGDLLRHHGGGAPYDNSLEKAVFNRLGVSPFYSTMYTPPLTWLGVPLDLLPIRAAEIIWYAVLLGSLLATWAMTRLGYRSADALRLTLALACVPVAEGLQFGQPVFVVMACVAGSYVLLRHDRDAFAGFLLLPVLLKPQLAFLVPVSLLASWRVVPVLVFAGGGLLVGAISFIVLGPGTAEAYIARLMTGAGQGSPFLVAKGLTVWGEFGRPVGLVVVLAIVAAILLISWNERHRPELALAAGLLASLLLTPFIHLQDLSMLLLAGWLFLLRRPGAWYVAGTVVVWIFLELAGSSIGTLPTLLVEIGAAVMLAAYAVRTRADRVAAPAPGTTMAG